MRDHSQGFDFGTIAGEYDKWYESCAGARYDWLEKRVLKRLLNHIPEEGKLLEMGSGTGWWSQFFSDLGYEVTGIDTSARMCELARRKNITRAVFRQIDAHDTGFADFSYSLTAAITTIEFTRDPEQVVREMVRLTRPGGYMILGVLNKEALLNQERLKKKNSLFSAARFFSWDELDSLLQRFGECRIIPCGFPLSLKLPRFLAGVCDDLQAMTGKRTAAFLAARVRVV